MQYEAPACAGVLSESGADYGLAVSGLQNCLFSHDAMLLGM